MVSIGRPDVFGIDLHGLSRDGANVFGSVTYWIRGKPIGGDDARYRTFLNLHVQQLLAVPSSQSSPDIATGFDENARVLEDEAFDEFQVTMKPMGNTISIAWTNGGTTFGESVDLACFLKVVRQFADTCRVPN